MAEIDHSSARNNGQIHLSDPPHPVLSVDGKQRLKSRVYNCIGFKDRQNIGDSDRPVRSQRAALCVDIIVDDRKLQPLLFVSVAYIGASVSVIEHVQMLLQNDTGLLLKAFACRLIDHDISEFIPDIRKRELFRKALYIVGKSLCMTGSVRNRTDLFKILKYT